MKILTIGDIHGYPTVFKHWKIEDFQDFDYIIFVGDYVDDFILSDSEIYENLVKIINLKKRTP